MGVRFSRKAAEDFEAIYLTGVELFGVGQAERYAEGLVEVLEFLAAFPRAARARPELGDLTRVHAYQSHIIIYRAAGPDIFVQRIRHAREDWEPR